MALTHRPVLLFARFRLLCATGLLLLAGSGSTNGQAGHPDARWLSPGQSLVSRLQAHQSHVYLFRLAARQYLRIEVEQRGADVELIVTGPNGQASDAVSRFGRLVGTETISVLADMDGVYRLDVRFRDNNFLPGSYEIKVGHPRPASALDSKRVDAERAFAAARQSAILQTGEGLRRSLESYEEAVRLWRETDDRSEQISALYWMGMGLEALREHDRALESFQEALALSRATGDRLQEIDTLAGLAYRAMNLQEWQQALDLHRQQLVLSREARDDAGEARALNGFGVVHVSVGDYPRAVDYYERALAVYQSFMGPNGRPSTLFNIGFPYLRMGAHQKAVGYYRQALEMAQADGSLNGQVIALGNLGEAYTGLGDARRAFDSYHRALEVIRSGGVESLEAWIQNGLGGLHASRGEDGPAMESYSRALALRQFNRTAEPVALSGIARLEQRRGNLQQARQRIEAALDLRESSRARVLSPDLRASYVASRRDDSEFYIALLMQMHEQEPQAGHSEAALHASERAHARSLLDLLTLSGMDLTQGIDPALKQRERDIHDQIARLQREWTSLNPRTSSGRRLAELEAALRQAEDERAQIEIEIRRSHPQYASVQYPTPSDLRGVQSLLDDDSVLLEYSLGADSSFLFAVTKSDFLAARLPPAQQLLDRVAKLRSAVASGPARSSLSAYRLQARVLYRELIEPAQKFIANKRALVIVPDLALHYLPFELLLTSDAAPGELNRLPYLVRQHAISYVPSASVLQSLRAVRSRAEPTKSFLAYADPEYGDMSARATDPARTALVSGAGSRGETLRRLAHSRREVNRIAALFPSGGVNLFLGRQAAETAVKTNELLDQHRYVHFAVHGMLNEERPQYSGLVMTRPEAGRRVGLDAVDDGLLQVYEIFNLKLNADLVVLSACETGLGKEVRGEGIVGLTRAFLYAGTRSVAVSLWQVADHSTPDLMVRFYQHLKSAPAQKAEALRRAQVELIEGGRFAHPFHWAPFVLVGLP